MKKLFSLLILALSLLFPFKQFALANASASLSKSAILVNYHGGEVLFEHNPDLKRPVASMCKIMTMLLIFEELEAGGIKLDEDITVSANASGMGGSQAFLETGGKYKAGDLIKSIVISSANDSCVALAERISGNEGNFIDRMNNRAAALGMKNTVFSNTTGLPRPGQFSTARDVAIMLKELLKHKPYFSYSRIWMDEITHSGGRVTELTNTNRLVRFYDGCDGGKTGYTAEAGHCLAASAMRGGMRLISVVIGAPDSKTRFEESKDILNFGFENYTNRMYIDDKKPLDMKITVRGGKLPEAALYAKQPFYRFTKRGEKENIELEFIGKDYLKAPVKKGQNAGKINVFKDSVLIGTVEVIAGEDIAAKSFGDYIKDIGGSWAI